MIEFSRDLIIDKELRDSLVNQKDRNGRKMLDKKKVVEIL